MTDSVKTPCLSRRLAMLPPAIHSTNTLMWAASWMAPYMRTMCGCCRPEIEIYANIVNGRYHETSLTPLPDMSSTSSLMRVSTRSCSSSLFLQKLICLAAMRVPVSTSRAW